MRQRTTDSEAPETAIEAEHHSFQEQSSNAAESSTQATRAEVASETDSCSDAAPEAEAEDSVTFCGGPFGAWAEADLRVLPRFPHQDSFRIAKGLINRYLVRENFPSLASFSYRDLRIALFWLGFGLLQAPTAEEPTIHLVPLCKDLNTYTDTAVELGYEPTTSVHCRPLFRRPTSTAVQKVSPSCPTVTAASSSSSSQFLNSSCTHAIQGQSSSSSSTPVINLLGQQRQDVSTSSNGASRSADRATTVASAAHGNNCSQGTSRKSRWHRPASATSQQHAQGSSTGPIASRANRQPNIFELKAKMSAFEQGRRRGSRPSSWPNGHDDEEGDEAASNGFSSSLLQQLQLGGMDAASSQSTDLPLPLAEFPLQGLDPEQEISHKVKLLHAGGWSSSSNSSNGSSTPPTPTTSTAVAANRASQKSGLDTEQMSRFTVCYVSGIGLEELCEETCLCTFCLDEMHPGEELCRLPCMHTFHRRCVHAWLARDRRCMLCRLDITLPGS